MLEMFKALDNLTEEVSSMHEEALNYLLEHNRIRVIYGVLKHLHVSPQTAYYEDLVTEGVLLFMQAYLDYQRKNDEINEKQLLGYAYRKIKWGLLDLLRKEWKLESYQSLSPATQPEETEPLSQLMAQSDLAEDYEFWELVRQIIMICTPSERKFLLKRLFYGYSVAEIAAQEGVSRQTVNNWKIRLQEKSREFFQM